MYFWQHPLVANPGRSVLDRAIARYGLTDYWPAAGYILPDGSMLDFSHGTGRRVEDHRNVGVLLTGRRAMSGSEVLDWFMRLTGAIRFMPESILFDAITEPTRAQLDRIEEIVETSGRPPALEMQRSRRERFYREYEEWNQRELPRDVREYWR